VPPEIDKGPGSANIGNLLGIIKKKGIEPRAAAHCQNRLLPANAA
jgi:hypothetical protein